MTVINDVKTALAGLKSAQASFEKFALGTENQQAKQLYQDAAKQTQSVLQSVEPRVQQIEQEEPQYAQDGNQASQGSTQVSQGQYGTEFASQNNAQQVRQQNQRAQSRNKNN